MRESTGTMSIFMKIQAIAFLVYGLTFFLIPEFTLTDIFGYTQGQLPPLGWARVLGAVFIGLAVAEYLCDRNIVERLDLVWIFALIPALILASNIWDRVADEFTGTDRFFWSTIGVTVFFTLVIGIPRLMYKEPERTSAM